MSTVAYGHSHQTLAPDILSQHAEAIALRGYTILPDLFDAAQLANWREKIDAVYAQQESEFGADALAAIGELDACRAPLLYDLDFLHFADHPRVLEVVQHFLGHWFILNLQNVIINRPGRAHHQATWHRDLPYQNFVISKPFAINALIAVDDFSAESGGTQFLPFSHKNESLPSDHYIAHNAITPALKAGSAILFDPMLFHRAGVNTGSSIRRGVNQLYTAPIIKQQVDLPQALGAREFDAATSQLLGYTAQVPRDDKAWRAARAAKGKRP